MVGATEILIYSWVARSRIEYRDLYMRLYVAYNAWHQKVTGSTQDYHAVQLLKKRFVIWDEYAKGGCMRELRPILTRIVTLTHKTPLNNQLHYWNGVVNDVDDWQGLIHYWYEVRCKLFHGQAYTEADSLEVQLAYESLYCFMTEIVHRMKRSFIESDATRLAELRILVKHDDVHRESYLTESMRLHQKYIYAPDMWAVDVQRMSG